MYSYSDVKILSQKYTNEFEGRHIEDIPEEEYKLAMTGYAK